MTQLVRVQNFLLSSDGFGAGEGQCLEAPFGRATAPVEGGAAANIPADLVGWAFGTASWAGRQEPGGSRGLDDYFSRDFANNIGAEIMGAGMFGLHNYPADADWKGWWGDNPPYHCDTFVLTHHARAPLVMQGGTTFHFVNDSIEAVLRRAMESAQGKDVRVGGGVATVRQYLQAGLIDEMHIAQSPALLGAGEPLFAGLNLKSLGYKCVERTCSPRATHIVLQR